MRLGLQIGVSTRRGRSRAFCEDVVAAGDWISHGDQHDKAFFFETSAKTPLLVADGMGGVLGGAIASRLAIDQTLSHLLSGLSPAQSIEKANDVIYQRCEIDPRYLGMGSTMSVVVIEDGIAEIANVGDSPVFALVDGYLIELSEDHSVGNALTQSVGGRTIHTPVVPAVSKQKLEKGSTILMCSDGLVTSLSLDEIESLLASSTATAAELADAAVAATGPHDDVSVILVKVR